MFWNACNCMQLRLKQHQKRQTITGDRIVCLLVQCVVCVFGFDPVVYNYRQLQTAQWSITVHLSIIVHLSFPRHYRETTHNYSDARLSPQKSLSPFYIIFAHCCNPAASMQLFCYQQLGEKSANVTHDETHCQRNYVATTWETSTQFANEVHNGLVARQSLPNEIKPLLNLRQTACSSRRWN